MALVFVSTPAVPPEITKSSIAKLLPTSSLNTNEKVTTPEVNGEALMATVGATVSGPLPPPPQALIKTEVAKAQAVRANGFANRFIE